MSDRRRRRRGPLWQLLKAFDRGWLAFAWALLLIGVLGVILTAIGVAPQAGHDLWARMATCVAWFLVAKEGATELRDELADQFDAD